MASKPPGMIVDYTPQALEPVSKPRAGTACVRRSLAALLLLGVFPDQYASSSRLASNRRTRRITAREVSKPALAKLDEIWDWNAEQYGRVHADLYVGFLRKRTDRLSTEYASGKPVPTNPKLCYRVIQRKRKRHGHLVVYEVKDADIVRILYYFHTAQDWQSKVG